jgi:hypothetical protein
MLARVLPASGRFTPVFPTDFPTRNPLQPGFGGSTDAFAAKIQDTVVVNALVSFTPLRATFRFISDTAGCPRGFAGKFLFDARLTNTGGRALSGLLVQVRTLSNGHRLLTDEGLIRPGGSFEVPRRGGFADGRLGPRESVDVPFTACLRTRTAFRLRADVLAAR